jgi:hypothetical protein
MKIMKRTIFKNLCPIRHGQALCHYWQYIQDIGERPSGYLTRIYGGKNYITIIKQTKVSIIVRIA